MNYLVTFCIKKIPKNSKLLYCNKESPKLKSEDLGMNTASHFLAM